MRTLLLVAVLTGVVGGCSAPPAPVRTTATTPPTTTTSEVPGADPVAWAEAWCGPRTVSMLAAAETAGHADMAATKTAVVKWASTAAAAERQIVLGIEKLGPLGSDVQNPHDRLVKALRQAAERYDAAAARLRELAADDKFPERYEQVMAGEMGSVQEEADALFKQIATTPKYADTFKTNKLCVEMQEVAKRVGGK